MGLLVAPTKIGPMTSTRCSFEVLQAGCESCADRIRKALSPLVIVEQITIDEQADTARVLIRAERTIGRATIEEALGRASLGSGHEYRVKRDSWHDASNAPAVANSEAPAT
jgi:hypothetical protein